MYVTLCIVHKHLHMCDKPNQATVCRLRVQLQASFGSLLFTFFFAQLLAGLRKMATESCCLVGVTFAVRFGHIHFTLG